MSTNPRGPTPPLYGPSPGGETAPSRSLVEGLGSAVDGIRQIATDLGARPHKYHSVSVQWSGGDIGRGNAEVVRDVAITPTPGTETVGWVDRQLESAGLIERGDLVLVGISPRFTEDEIEELFGVNSPPGVETFVEQRIDSRDGETRRRRYILAKAPERRPTHCDWRVTLRKADGDRDLEGVARVERERVWR